MDRSMKIVIVVLVAITMIFVITLAGGHRAHGGSGSPSLVDSLKGLKHTKVLKPGDKGLEILADAGCSVDNATMILSVSSSCRLTVTEAGRFSAPREVDLQRISGAPSVFEIPAGRDQTDTKSLEGDPVSFTFDRKGGSIAILCFPGGCQLQFTTGS